MTDLALAVLKHFEHFEPKVYLDPVGVPTIGYGHALLAGEAEELEGRALTEREAELLLIADFEQHRRETEVATVGARLELHELEALTSWVFNLGVARLVGSPKHQRSTLHKLLMAGAPRLDIAREFLRWRFGKVKGQSVVLPGLVRRRHVEAVWFLGAPAETVTYLLGGLR